MESFGIVQTVAGVDRAAVPDRRRVLVRPVPVERCIRIAAHLKNALRIGANLATVLVAQRDFIARHWQPRGPQFFFSAEFES
jgi:F420-0:gamma-glutamyl ligase